jgi:tRNA splicing endonuclease|uniref:tRNA-intron lyase n=1 Tax=Globisporangium ultimum (strain ATCC 200006 / CBS 805.95 / DAOM BR144) TaxID=431595 RepID=K3WRN1_GLOUD
MVVTWDAEQLQAATITVHFDDTHASAWQFYQSRALGTTAATLPPLAPAAAGAIPSKPRVRTRLLSLAETFYVLLTNTDGGVLAAPHALGSHKQLWGAFSTTHPGFQRQFVVQYHFREQGWVLKSGLNYGAHHVLYRGAPDAYHSEYIVYVKEVQELPWVVVQALTRVAADVKKTVLICEVAATQCSPSSIQESPTLTHGHYEFVGHAFEFTAIAIRFMDVALPDGAQAPKAGATLSLSSPFAFQPQPVVLKKKRNKKPKKQP